MIRLPRFYPLFLSALVLAFLVFIGSTKESGAQTSTTTALQLSPACTTPGCVTTLTATVVAGGAAVHPGLVIFCAGTADCTSGGQLGSAQLLANGTATIKLGIETGAQTVHAIFHGTKTFQKSASTPQIVDSPANPADKVLAVFTPTVAAYAPDSQQFQASASLLFTGPEPPTGTVTFIDTSRNNAVLDTVPIVGPQYGYGLTYPYAHSLDLSKVPASIQTGTRYDATGDFNNDGFQDILVKDANTNLTVLIGDGKGGFIPGSYVNKTNAYGPIIVGDFNSDGKLDFAISDSSTSTVHVSLGNGDGTFTPVTPTSMSDSPQYLASGDFNNDGVPDIATVGYIGPSGNRTIHVILGKGDGTFTPLTAVPVDGSPRMLAIADFNQDGNLDIATSYHSISLLKGNGDGTFSVVQDIFGEVATPYYLVAGDFDGDGVPDLIYAGNATFAYDHGNGDGTFTGKGSSTSPYADQTFDSPFLTGSYHGAYPSTNPYNPKGTLGVVADVAMGGLEGIQLFGPFGVTGAPSTFQTAFADFDGDGLPDIISFATPATKSALSNRAQILINATATSAKGLILDAGVHNIIATYSGDAFHSPVTTAPIAVTGRTVAFGGGFPDNSALAFNGGASVHNGTLKLTNGGQFEAGSVFSPKRVSRSFLTEFDFISTKAASDGFAFVFQSNGPNAIGSSGGGIGYGNPPGGTGASITNSFAFVLDSHNNQGEGSNSLRLEVNGVTSPAGALDLTPSFVDLHNGHKYHVVINGYGNDYTFTINDYQQGPRGYVSFSANFQLPSDQLPYSLGYVGFTGSTGASTGTPTILNWTLQDKSTQLSPLGYPAPTYPDGFAGSTGLSFRGGAAVSGSDLQLTNGSQFTSSSVFTTAQVVPSGPYPVYQNFATDFDFEIEGGVGDGFAFVLQNQGLNALGTPGGGLGYGPTAPGAAGASIKDSIAIKFDLHDNYGESPNSTGFYVNGASPTVPSIDLTSSGVHLYSGHPFHAQITYNSTTLTLSITDLTDYKVFTQVLYTGSDLPTLVPAQAYAGFTAGTGATASSIKISNWTWTYLNQYF